MTGFRFKPGDWAVDSAEHVARVIRVYALDGEELLDLSIYKHSGDRLGRRSPRCGGPASFEPACAAEYWQRIRRPAFPMRPMWVPNGDGTASMRIWAGPRLPPANWTPPELKSRAPALAEDRPPFLTPAEYRHLAELFDGANDPVSAGIGVKAAAVGRWFAARGL